MVHKLENPKRIEELSPLETLHKIGVSKDTVFCDIGAGTGIFSYAAAKITQKPIFAVEISAQMREILRSKKKGENLTIQTSITDVPTDSCGVALLCTVLHELDDVPDMMKEIRRILKNDGTLAIIEFHKEITPMGPPLEHRISETGANKILTENGFIETDSFRLGENFYCLVCKPI